MRYQSAFVLGGLFAIAVGVGCSNTTSSPVAPVRAGGSSATPSPAPIGSATPIPSTAPSAAPSGEVGNLNCTAGVITVPGNYLSIETSGNVVGSTYTSDVDSGENEYEVDTFTEPTPSPTPTIAGSPTPSPVPSVGPSFTPAPTPTPAMITIYVGEYSYPAFGGEPSADPSASPYSVAAGTGCFELILEQAVGGTAGQARSPFLKAHRPSFGPQARRPNGDDVIDNAFGLGEPNEGENDFAETLLDFGPLTSLSITGLTPSTGTGTFIFSTATSTGVTGSLTITGSETFSSDSLARFRFSGRFPRQTLHTLGRQGNR